MPRQRLHESPAAKQRAYRDRKRRGPLTIEDWHLLAVIVSHLALTVPKDRELIDCLAERLHKLALFFRVDLLEG